MSYATVFKKRESVASVAKSGAALRGEGERGTAPGIVNRVLEAPGQALDASTRGFFEPRFGCDFSKVRVHTDPQAAESANSVNALAYTVGAHVVLGAGTQGPSSLKPDPLLAHELAHVVQQTSGSSQQVSTLQSTPVGGAAEQEASRAAINVTQGRPLAPLSPQPVGLARQPAPASDTPTDSSPQSVYAGERRRAAKASDVEIKEQIAKTSRQLKSVSEAKTRVETLGTVALVAAGVLIGALAGGMVGGGPAGAVIGGIAGGVIVGTLGRVLLVAKLDKIKTALSDKLRAWEEEQLLRERAGSTAAPPTVNVEDLPKAPPPTVNVEDLPKAK